LDRAEHFRVKQRAEAAVIKSRTEADVSNVVELFPDRKSVTRQAMQDRADLSKEHSEEAFREKCRAATERLRQKRIWELSHVTKR
jgi:hypothetical protein